MTRTLVTLLLLSTALGCQSEADSDAQITPTGANKSAATASMRHGQVQIAESSTQVWDEQQQLWVTPEAFWQNYAERNQAAGRGKHWGSSTQYPTYADANEHDTMLIELEQGSCLMYFFHRRWRRAQDVRRWDPAFNRLGGCPYVFN